MKTVRLGCVRITDQCFAWMVSGIVVLILLCSVILVLIATPSKARDRAETHGGAVFLCKTRAQTWVLRHMLNYHSTDGILAAKDYLIDQVHPIRQCELLRNARVGYAITVEALKASYPDYVHYVGTLRLQNGHPRHFLTTEPPLNYDDRLGHQLASE